MKLKAFAGGLLLQSEMLGDGDVSFATKDENGNWVEVSGIELIHNGNNGDYTIYPLVDDSPSGML